MRMVGHPDAVLSLVNPAFCPLKIRMTMLHPWQVSSWFLRQSPLFLQAPVTHLSHPDVRLVVLKPSETEMRLTKMTIYSQWLQTRTHQGAIITDNLVCALQEIAGCAERLCNLSNFAIFHELKCKLISRFSTRS